MGVAGAGYGIDRLASRKVPTRPPYSKNYVNNKLAMAQQSLKTIGSRIGDLPVPVFRMEEMMTNIGVGAKHIYVEMNPVRDVMQMASSVKIRGKEPKKSPTEDTIVTELLNTKPKNSPVPDRWIEKGGKVEIDEAGTWIYTNKNGQSVSYTGGYPDFTS
ncbi:MAG: hypothetical protein ACQEWW_22430 [Bacillota bacterium]